MSETTPETAEVLTTNEQASEAPETASAKKPRKVPAPKEKEKAAPSIWGNEKRVKIVKAMRALRATTTASGRTATEIAAKAGVTPQDAKHYLYKEQALPKKGYVKIAKHEGSPLLVYYLTASGSKVEMK